MHSVLTDREAQEVPIREEPSQHDGDLSCLHWTETHSGWGSPRHIAALCGSWQLAFWFKLLPECDRIISGAKWWSYLQMKWKREWEERIRGRGRKGWEKGKGRDREGRTKERERDGQKQKLWLGKETGLWEMGRYFQLLMSKLHQQDKF